MTDSKPSVLVARRLPQVGANALAAACEVRRGGLDVTPVRLLELAPGVDAIVVDNVLASLADEEPPNRVA